MTKYSKITKSSFAIIALSLILVAVLAFGGTYAYFSDKAEATGTATAGVMGLSLGSTTLTLADTSIVPNQKVNINDVTITYDSGMNVASALRVSIAKTGDLSEVLTLSAVSGWVENDGYYYYSSIFDTTGPTSLTGLTVQMASTAGNDYQGATATITLTVEMVQAEYVGGDGTVQGFKAGDTVSSTNVADVAALFTTVTPVEKA